MVLFFCLSACSREQLADVTQGESTSAYEESEPAEPSGLEEVQTTEPVTTQEQSTAVTDTVQMSQEEAADLFNRAVKQTKAKGSLIGSDQIQLMNLDVGEQSASAMNTINNTLDQVAADLFTPSEEKELPFGNQNQVDILVTAIASYEVKETKDSYILYLVPEAEENPSARFQGPQGRVFELFEDFPGKLDGVALISFTGSAKQAVQVTYDGGSVELTIDKESNLITGAQYRMVAQLQISSMQAGGGVTVTDAGVDVVYTVSYNQYQPVF
ncbi:MAG: hypothetical protein LIO46_05315 [Clostridiales bacterium]|nr:hypothetical protein [Clostridiales bacterium]